MSYKLFTMPHCDQCATIKEFLKENSIEFTEVDLGDDDGVSELRQIYPKLKDKITRTEDGQMPVPLFVSDDFKVANSLEEVKAIVG